MYVRQYVDPNFLDLLHRLDPDLEPMWDPKRDRWVILRRGKYILTVQTADQDGKYAPLDNRVIQKLFLIDTHRYANEFGLVRHLHLEDDALYRMKRKEQDEFIRACARDAAPFLRGRHTVNAKVQDDKAKSTVAKD